MMSVKPCAAYYTMYLYFTPPEVFFTLRCRGLHLEKPGGRVRVGIFPEIWDFLELGNFLGIYPEKTPENL